MGREVRMVPPDWAHPKDERGNYVPLLKGPYTKRLAEWDLGAEKFAEGLVEKRRVDGSSTWVPKAKYGYQSATYEDWAGKRPRAENYMPEFTPGAATRYMMYENVSEGTPISPAFDTPEKLAQWLVDNDRDGCSYEGWLRVAKGGYAPSFVISGGVMRSGVEP